MSSRLGAWLLFVLAGLCVAYVVFALVSPWAGDYLGVALLVAVGAVIVAVRLLRKEAQQR